VNRSLSGDTKDALANELPTGDAVRATLAAALLAYGVQRPEGWLTRRLSIARALHRLWPGATIHKTPGHASFIVQCTGSIPTLAPIEQMKRSRTQRRMELRGAFLACGSLSVGKRGGYHLEFVMHADGLAERLSLLIHLEELEVKRMMRREHLLLYLKDSEHIITLLSAMGAYITVLQLEDVRAVKETKNRIRRIVNTEAANLDRTIDAASSARTAIEAVIDAHGLQTLSPALREAATLRLAHPLASIAELAAYCSPPVSKSTFSGRLVALRKRAAGLV